MKYILFTISFLLFLSCESIFIEDESSSDARTNFDALWTVLNEKYSYFELKNINWQDVYDEYLPLIEANPSVLEEFDIYQDMLFTLQDGHVNLRSSFDVSRNWNWYLNYPDNFDADVVERNYLGNNHRITGGIRHTLLEDSNIAYLRYSSFSNSVENIDLVTLFYPETEGMIIDVRDNGGGSLQNAYKLVNRFASSEQDLLKIYTKTGPGATDFSAPTIHRSSPTGSYNWNKPIVLLTNRKCYSATSFFVTMMKQLPNVTVIGDSTGGGAGAPADYLLPNGWLLRYSATRTTDANDVDFELGVSPDIQLNLDENLVLNEGKDNIIERAIEEIL